MTTPKPAKVLPIGLVYDTIGSPPPDNIVTTVGSPYLGSEYIFRVTLTITPVPINTPDFGTNSFWDGTHVAVGDWIATRSNGTGLQIKQIISQTDSLVVVFAEDVNYVNLAMDQTQSNNAKIDEGAGYLFEMGSDRLPILYTLFDTSPGAMTDSFASQISSRFLDRRAVEFPPSGTILPLTGYRGYFFYNNSTEQLFFWNGTTFIPINSAVSATAPSNPRIGQLWYDPVDKLLKVWDGTAWVPVSAPPSGTTNPVAGLYVGQTFYNTTDQRLYAWNGTAWKPVGIPNSGSTNPSGTGHSIGDTFYNTTEQKLYAWNGTSWVAVGGSAKAGTTLPGLSGNSVGDLFYNTTDGKLYVWDGTQWKAIGGDSAKLTTENATAGTPISLTGTGSTTLYTVPVGKTAIILGCHIANKATADSHFSITINDVSTSQSYSAAYQVPIRANFAIEAFKRPKILNAGDSIAATPNAANVIDVTLTISEYNADNDLVTAGVNVTTANTPVTLYTATQDMTITSLLMVNTAGNAHVLADVRFVNGSNSVSLVDDFTVPYGSTVEICESPKYLSTGTSIVVQGSDANRLTLLMAGKKTIIN